MKKVRPFSQFCAQLRQQHLLRHLPHTRTFPHDFSTNDYLGLSQHPALIKAAIHAADQYGVGSKASRLLSLQQTALLALEADIARSKQTENALIFATGFQANLSAISALLDAKVLGATPLVFADRLNHASMHVACQLANVKQLRFRHCDYEHLAWLLQKNKNSKQPKFIFTESVFGMDGDVACLSSLIKLAKVHDAILYVDEAHATGVFGYGLTADFKGEIDICMGTFSKALGGSGAYIACSRVLKRYFINRCQGLIYSTAPSPMQVAAMHQAWELIPRLQKKAQQLLITAQDVRQQLQQLGFNTGTSTTHIIPLILQDAGKTLAAQRFFEQQGIKLSAIRPPSVPMRQSRLRIALTTEHSQEAIKALLQAAAQNTPY